MIASIPSHASSYLTHMSIRLQASRWLLTILLLISCSQPAAAQEKLLPVLRFKKLQNVGYNYRSRVVRDQEGFVWVGTNFALLRFDGYAVKDHRNVPDNPGSLSASYVSALLADRRNRLWVGTYDAGLSLYDRANDRFFNLLPRPDDTTWYQAKCITRILEDSKGAIWLASRYGGVVRLELPHAHESDAPESLLNGARFTSFHLGTPRNSASDLLERSDGRILVASDMGLLVLDPLSRSISHPATQTPTAHLLDTAEISCLCRDSGGSLWAGTKTSGVLRLDGACTTVLRYTHRRNDPLSLASDNIIDIAEDRSGELWISTDAGLDLFSPVTGQPVRYLEAGPAPRGPAWMMALSVDRTGTLWVTVDGAVYYLTPKSRTFGNYGLPARGTGPPIVFETNERDAGGNHWFSSGGKIYNVDLQSLTVKRIIDVFRGKKPTFGDLGTFVDKHGIYWYGAWGIGLFRIDLATGQVSNYAAGSGLGRDLTVNSIAQGPGDTLFVAAHYDGLMKFDPHSGKFLHIPGFPQCEAWTVHNDSRGGLWMTSSTNGVYLLDPATNAFRWLHHDPSNPHSLASDHGRRVFEDLTGRIWIGAGNIVHLWHPENGSVTRYPNPAFSRAPFAAPMGSDGRGKIWIDYLFAGLAVLDPSSGTFVNYDATDGLCDNFNEMDTLSGARLLLTTSEGLTIFHPDSIRRQRAGPRLVITRVHINDEPVNRPILVGRPPSFTLPYTRNVLEFEFAAIDVDAPYLVEYWYQLEGLEQAWVKSSGRRFVRYTSLSPGIYRFRVRASSSRGEWPDQEIALAISIAPPWWRTWWAYCTYGLMILALLSGGYRLRLKQVRLKQQAEMEHFQAEHLAEVDRLKSRFFSNISHEFRTPLTLILGPAEQGMETTEEQNSRGKFRLIRDNARKLNALVSQLLDFSRLESGMMRLQVSQGDLLAFLRRVVMSFESWAERKKIKLEFLSEVDPIEGFFDGDKLEKIVNNLVSNAVKFTPEGGCVSVRIGHGGHQNSDSRNEKPARQCRIDVSDTGPGISPEHLERIFDRFYRVDETHATEGTGIGLALTKELVDLHHGKITVVSVPGKGSVFTMIFPIDRRAFAPIEISESTSQPTESGQAAVVTPSADTRTVPSAPPAQGRPLVLIVEDNADLRVYIREFLDHDYAVHEAANGKEGHARATDIVPDLVISDIMMPEMDGIELCRRLKQDVRTSHVPVILLTARADSVSKIEGLGIGADDYLTKPFDSKELMARVRNLIEQRQQLRKKFSAGVVLKPGEVAVGSLDDALLKKIMQAVEDEMENDDFGVDDLAQVACLSRTHLNRKMHALTNLSPGEFIRYMRLQRARELLEKGAGSVAEIAYRVGFGNLSHFSFSFRERFGVLPSEVRGTQPQ